MLNQCAPMNIQGPKIKEVVSQAGKPPSHDQSFDPSNSTPSIKLEQAIREVVREELGRPIQHERVEPKPTLSDAVWWLLCVIDIGLLLWWIPETFFENRKVDFYIKAAAWVGSYLFLLSYAWFKDQILAFSRRRIFKSLIIGALVILFPVYVSLLPIFSLNPRVEPKTAELIVDGKTEAKVRPDDLRLSFGVHKITVVDASDVEGSPNSRPFQVGYSDFFRAWFWKDGRPYWPLLYAVAVQAHEPGVTIIIRKKDGDFDRDFANKKPTPSTEFGAPVKFIEPGKALSFLAIENVIDSISLPYGTYEFTGLKEGCGQSQPQSISSNDAAAQFVVEGLCK